MGKSIDGEVSKFERPPIANTLLLGKDGTWYGRMLRPGVSVVGAGVFTLIAMQGAKPALAESSFPGPDDSPEKVVADGKHYLVDELLAQGYTYEEIWLDFTRKGISKEEANHYNFRAGDVYKPHPDTVRARAERLGLVSHVQVLSEDNPTIISIMEANGVPMSRLDEVLKLNNQTAESARHLPVGMHITLPESTIPSMILTLDFPGDDYYGDFVRLGIAEHAVQILKDNGLTPEMATKQQVGHSIVVAGKYLQPTKSKPHETPLPVSPANQPEQIIPLPLAPKGTVQAETPLTPPTREDSSLYLLGDSLSQGASELGDIQSVGSSNGLDVTVDAVPGRSLEEAILDINIGEILKHDTLVIELGTNAKETDERYIKNLRDFINLVRFTASGMGVDSPKIYLINLYEEAETNRVPDETRNALLSELADEIDAEIIDWNSHAAENPDLYKGGDTIHPSDYPAFANFIIDAVAPSEPVEAPSTQVPESDPLTLIEMLEQQRQQYANGTADLTWLRVFLAQTMTHPEINPELGITEENVHRIFNLPNPQTGFEYIVNPQTCVYETIGSAEVFATIITIQDYAMYLINNDPRFAYLKGKNVTLQLGDINSPPHNTHYNSRAADLFSTFSPYTIDLHPDGPLFMSGSPHYDQLLNELVMRFAISLTMDGELVLEHIITGDSEAEEHIMGGHAKGDAVVEDDGHSNHWHLYFNEKFAVPGQVIKISNFPNDPSSCDDVERTGGPTAFEVLPDDIASQPQLELNPEPAPEAESPAETPENEAPATTTVTQNPPEKERAVPGADALKLSPEEYIAKYNNGENYKVALYNGTVIDVDPKLQQLVDYIWRVEGGVSAEDAMDAYKVAFAESGHNNSAVNSAGDRCYFQVSPVNRKFVESHGIDYDSLQDNPEACVRAALEIFKNAQGRVYTEEIVSEWEQRFGLKLPSDLRAKAVAGYVSRGWYPWLMSARNSGVL